MSDSKNSKQAEDLPSGWASAYSDDWGEIYYYNIHTRETTWYKPELKGRQNVQLERSDKEERPLSPPDTEPNYSSSQKTSKKAQFEKSDEKKNALSPSDMQPSTSTSSEPIQSAKKYIAELEQALFRVNREKEQEKKERLIAEKKWAESQSSIKLLNVKLQELQTSEDQSPMKAKPAVFASKQAVEKVERERIKKHKSLAYRIALKYFILFKISNFHLDVC